MSEKWVDEIADRAGTGWAQNKNTLDDSDDSRKIADTAWVRNRMDNFNSDQAATSEEVATGTVTDKYVSPATIGDTEAFDSRFEALEASSPLKVASVGGFDGSVASPTLDFEEGNTHAVSKSETGSYDITLTNNMQSANYIVLVSKNTNNVSVEVKSQTVSSFNLTCENQSGANADITDLRFVIVGELA